MPWYCWYRGWDQVGVYLGGVYGWVVEASTLPYLDSWLYTATNAGM